MPLYSRFLSLAIALLLAASAHGQNWERFRGPNGEGTVTGQNLPVKFSTSENVRWKTPIAGVGHSSPIVWGDRIFLQTAGADASDRSLLCLDAKSGKILWERSIPGILPRQKLRYDTSLASASATTDGEAVYIPFWNGQDIIMAAYNFEGDKLWYRNLGEFVSQHGAAASPILYKNLLIFAFDRDAHRDTTKRTGPVPNPATLYALDKRTGKTVWQEPREGIRACYSIPFLLEKPGATPELIVTSTTAITSYNPDSGKSNWYWHWTFAKDPLRTIASTSHANGMLLAMSGDGSGERLMVAVALKGQGKDTKAEQAWANPKEFPYVTNPLIKGEHVYFVNDLGRVGCFEVKTGKKRWFETMADAKFYASPVLIDGKIYAASEQGDVFVFPADPKAYRELARNRLGEVIRATPAVANGSMYIRTASHLYCIGNK